MKLYRTAKYSNGIEAREVLRHTDKTVWFAEPLSQFGRYTGTSVERKEPWSSGWHHWHLSWDDAHAYLMGLAESRLTDARRALQDAQDKLGNVKGMKKPQEAA